ncbi:hypothetical protein [Nocardioides mangrovi]|uniref:Uncharacterized protein n=1 Tax=Nocardioides mangrovi TaxID=2874580 RepID=A0ABS7UGE2_9ACTN|nr:hypothetical protein [Nocardioides mangrovi]MBZ5739865.1 hypothetical protein [Nocardioides mangrovi]
MTAESSYAAVDPFELPEWLGERDVTWAAESGLRSGPGVTGLLSAEGDASLGCDLLAVDAAYPVPVAPEGVRLRAHQAWHHGEVHLVDHGGRLTLVVPGTGFTADLVLDAVSRLARAVGASAEHYSVRLRIGGSGR